jgi:hypothetical protein
VEPALVGASVEELQAIEAIDPEGVRYLEFA